MFKLTGAIEKKRFTLFPYISNGIENLFGVMWKKNKLKLPTNRRIFMTDLLPQLPTTNHFHIENRSAEKVWRNEEIFSPHTQSMCVRN